MKNIVLAKRYARALFEIAEERNILASLHREVISFEQNMQANAAFRMFLFAQDVSQKEKAARIERTLQDCLSGVFLNFLLVLLKKNREVIFETIAAEFQRLVDRKNKLIRATTTTAVPLDQRSLEQMKSVLDQAFNSDVQINNKIDESILGGIIVSVDGRLLDGSLKRQLHRLGDQLAASKNGSA